MLSYMAHNITDESVTEIESARIGHFSELFTFTNLKQSYWGSFSNIFMAIFSCQKAAKMDCKSVCMSVFGGPTQGGFGGSV